MCACLDGAGGVGRVRRLGEPEMVGSFALLFKSGVPGMSGEGH